MFHVKRLNSSALQQPIVANTELEIAHKQFVDIKTQSGLFHVKQHILLRVVSMNKICLGMRV